MNIASTLQQNSSEEAFAVKNLQSSGLVIDSDFPPSDASLYPDPSQPPASASPLLDGNVTWKRIEGPIYVPSPLTPRFKLGKSGVQHRSFLSALSAVACRSDLILDLIVSDDHSKQGCYTCQLYKHGFFQPVCVDNLIPCLDGSPAFLTNIGSKSLSSPDGIWPSIIEKAYAKVHGSYYSLEGGSIAEFLVDLTGGVVDQVVVDTSSASDGSDLFAQLSAATEAASIISVESKLPQDESTSGPHGLLTNFYYTVLETLVTDDGVKLVRMHSPWGDEGLWTGPWSPNSLEVQSTVSTSSSVASSPATDRIRASLEDKATFWISIKDFASFFNLIYICKILPPTWHQLVLHCGWQGASAGGPYFSNIGTDEQGEPIISPSSTWCCNPQFRITVRRPGEMIVSLGQVDPRVENRRHVKEEMRRKSIGFMVVRTPLSSLGRKWSVAPQEILHDCPLTVKREASTSFSVDPEFAYCIIPYSGRPGDEGAFVLRTFSSAPVEMEQLPSPLSIVLGGQWSGMIAGGSPNSPTFGSNPQYVISCQQSTQVILSCTRLDIKYAIVKPEHQEEGCVGLFLLNPETETEGDTSLARCTSVRSISSLKAESGFRSMEEAVVSFQMDPGSPYIVVPCLNSPGIEAPFELRIMSAVPVELVPLPEVKCMVLHGEWNSLNSGGCDMSPLWKKNPRYLLVLSSKAKIK